ncbi:2613_t:CDS:2 [Entrophospora sp. SA101]|nr:2613_t:CDS:2 [Entrophospora sp. SA101]
MSSIKSLIPPKLSASGIAGNSAAYAQLSDFYSKLPKGPLSQHAPPGLLGRYYYRYFRTSSPAPILHLIVNKNSYNDIQPCGCFDAKSTDLLEATPINLVKSFFIVDKVKSAKKLAQSIISIEYLNGHNQIVSSEETGEYNDLKTYLQPLPVDQEVTRKDLNISDEPREDNDLEKVRKQILIYFQEHGIEKVRVEAKGVNSLTLNDLKKGNNNQELGYGKILFYGGIAVVVFCVVGLIAYLAYRSEKNRPRGY